MSATRSSKPRPKGAPILPKLPRGDGTLNYSRDKRGDWQWPGPRAVRLQHAVRVGGVSKTFEEFGADRYDCEAKRDERRARFAGVAVSTAAGRPVNIAALFADQLPFIVGDKAPMTKDSYTYVISKLELVVIGRRPAFGLLPIEALEGPDGVALVEHVLLAMTKRHGEGTIPKLRSMLHRSCQYAVKRGWLSSNPLHDADTPAGAKPAREAAWFDDDTYELVRRHLVLEHSSEHALFATMLLTGLRPGEAMGLLWEHVHFDTNTIDVRTAMQRSDGGRTSTITDKLKTRKSRRTVRMPDDLRAVLAREREAQLARGHSGDGAVFLYPDGSRWRHNVLRNGAKRIARELGIDYVNANGYRHTFGSLMLHRGMPAASVAKLMGHVDTRQLMKTYEHAMDELPDSRAFLGTPLLSEHVG